MQMKNCKEANHTTLPNIRLIYNVNITANGISAAVTIIKDATREMPRSDIKLAIRRKKGFIN